MSVITAFRDAWKNRKPKSDAVIDRDLALFLPAALEIQQRPPNPAAKWLGRIIMLMFVSLVVWALIGRVNIVASAEGKIVPNSRVKQVQAYDRGAITGIYVQEGDRVEQGQLLVEFDATQTQADEQRLQAQLNDAVYKRVSYTVVLTLLENSNLNFDQAWQSAAPGLDIPELNERYYRLALGEWTRYRSQQQELNKQRELKVAEYAVSQSMLKKIESSIPLVTERAAAIKSLSEQGMAAHAQFLELEQARLELEYDLAAESQRLKTYPIAVAQIDAQSASLTAQTSAAMRTALAELESQINTLREELSKATDFKTKQSIKAPVAGKVQQLMVSTIGGVVTPAQVLMLIVPEQDTLEAEVFITNKDIGFVQEGMPAEVKIHTFPFTKYGLINSEVTYVSVDAIQDEKMGAVFLMKLALKQSALKVDGKTIDLKPGMTLTAEIQTGERRLIEFFMAPLLRARQEAVRER